MEKPKRARRRKPDIAKADLEPRSAVPGGQSVHREVESEGHEDEAPSLQLALAKSSQIDLWRP
jgi:hypothetical protein